MATKTTPPAAKAVRLYGNHKTAVYAIEFDGQRVERYTLYVERYWRNSKSLGFKGYVTDVRIVDREILDAGLAEAAETDIMDRSRATDRAHDRARVVKAGSVKDAVVKLNKMATSIGGLFAALAQ